MKPAIVMLVAASLIGGVIAPLAPSAQAAERGERVSRAEAELKRRHPSASRRQIRNALAYERGEYYEQIPDAHPVGSRSWWYLKEREMGSNRN
jgi:hypothetical protein